MSRTQNYIPFEIKYEGKIEQENTFYPFDIKKIGTYSDNILNKSEEYIITRANVEFLKKLKIQQIEVNYLDPIKIEYDNENLYNLSNYNVTFWILYTYENRGFKYAFGLEFDKSGKMISENKFPKFSKNSEYEKIIDPCEALEKVKSNKNFKNKKIDFIELSYLDEINSFCWLIQEKYEVYDNQKIEFEKYYNYSESQFYINANTNEFVTEKINQKSVIYSGYKNIKMIKKD